VVSASIQSHTFASARRLVRVARPAAAIVAVLAMTFVVTNRAGAATTTKIKASISNGTLIVTGSNGNDNISLRLRNGDPTTLEIVDVSKAVILSVNRNDFINIRVSTLAGADTVAVDESGGIFTDTESTSVDGGPGNDNLIGGSRPCMSSVANRHSTRCT
jgi:hypothetical protein